MRPDMSDDIDVATDPFDDIAVDAVETPAPAPRKNLGGRKRNPVDAGMVRRVIAKHAALLALPNGQRAMVAGLLGVDADDVTELTIRALAGTNSPAAAYDELVRLRSLEPMERGVHATALVLDSREKARAVWRLVGLSVPGPKELPANVVKAGLALGQSVSAVTDAAMNDLASALELLSA